MQDADYLVGHEEYRRQFDAQLSQAGAPHSEHAVHFCLALGFQRAYGWTPGDIVFERPCKVGRIDLWLRPRDCLVEMKYLRPIPSGRNVPATQLYGSLLADFNKICHVEASDRLVSLVADARAAAYLARSGRDLLPMSMGESRLISESDIARLPRTASANAVDDAPWVALKTSLIAAATTGSWSLFSWRVAPAP